MAYVDKIWFHSSDLSSPNNKEMTVYIKLHPAGEVGLKVEVPQAFKDAIVKLAQTSADAHEAQMHAQLLGEKSNV